MSAKSCQRPAREAWLIPGPGPDERLGSVVDRAANLYGTTADNLLAELSGGRSNTIVDADAARPQDIVSMARAMGVSSRALWSHRLPDHPSLLAPGARRAMCPMCWEEDRAAGRPRAYRRDWAGVLRTTCSRHATALEFTRSTAFGWDVRSDNHAIAMTEEKCVCLAAIEHFGRTLEGALFFDCPWPTHWALSPQRARSALLAASLNLSQEEAFPPLSRMIHPSMMTGLVRTPLHVLSPLRGPPWEAFRAIADPMLRRAALWLVGWWTCPEWLDAWRPDGFRGKTSELIPDQPAAVDRVAQRLNLEVVGRF